LRQQTLAQRQPVADLSYCISQSDVLTENNVADVTVLSGNFWICKRKQVSCSSASAGRSTASRGGLGLEPGSRYLGRYQSP